MFPNIDAERARLGISKSDLAKELGVSYSTIKSWMNGKTDMSCSKVIAMSKLFGVSSDYLLGLTHHEPKSA